MCRVDLGLLAAPGQCCRGSRSESVCAFVFVSGPACHGLLCVLVPRSACTLLAAWASSVDSAARQFVAIIVCLEFNLVVLSVCLRALLELFVVSQIV